jgi:hypothetical protein
VLGLTSIHLLAYLAIFEGLDGIIRFPLFDKLMFKHFLYAALGLMLVLGIVQFDLLLLKYLGILFLINASRKPLGMIRSFAGIPLNLTALLKFIFGVTVLTNGLPL